MIRTSDALSLAGNERAAGLDVRARPLDHRRVLVAVEGDLDLATAPALKTALLDVLARGQREIVLDLSGVGHMDSTGLAVLIGFRERLKDNGRLGLAATPANVLRVLGVAGLTDQFELIPSVEELTGSAVEHPIGGRSMRLTADAEIAVGLLATALPFAESRRAEAERWLRVLQSHGDTARMLSDIGLRESARTSAVTPSVETVDGSTLDGREPIHMVLGHAARLAGRRGVNAIGTIELLAAVIEVYGKDFDAVLAARGAAPGAVIGRLNEEASRG